MVLHNDAFKNEAESSDAVVAGIDKCWYKIFIRSHRNPSADRDASVTASHETRSQTRATTHHHQRASTEPHAPHTQSQPPLQPGAHSSKAAGYQGPRRRTRPPTREAAGARNTTGSRPRARSGTLTHGSSASTNRSGHACKRPAHPPTEHANRAPPAETLRRAAAEEDPHRLRQRPPRIRRPTTEPAPRPADRATPASRRHGGETSNETKPRRRRPRTGFARRRTTGGGEERRSWGRPR